MEKKIPFASDVILIDAAFLDRVGKDMAAHFAPLVGRELPKADLAVLLERYYERGYRRNERYTL